MLNENIRLLRKAKGLSQEELAVKLNVVRQTVSKWETGASVPDAQLLIALSEALDTSVTVLLGETVSAAPPDELRVISEKLEIINLQLAKARAARRKTWHWLFIALAAVITVIFLILLIMDSPYLSWDYSDPERAVAGVALHAFEWIFIRVAPLLFLGAAAGAILTRK